MRIELHKNFTKVYAKLTREIQEKFKERRDLFLENKFHPFLNNHSVGKTFSGCRSINVTGDYRAIFKENDDGSVVFMLIGTHSELYG